MPRTLACPNCGETVALPESFDRAKIRCPGCGSYAAVPPGLRAAAPPEVHDRPAARPVAAKAVPRATVAAPAVQAAAAAEAPVAKRRIDPRDTRPDFTPDEPAGVPLLAGTRDEDDEKPYAVPGTGLLPCPHCRQDLPLNATFCVHCGKTLAGGEQAERVHQPMSGTWEEGLPLRKRLYILAGLQVLNFFGAVLTLATQNGGIVEVTFFNVFHVALQCFLVGSFDTLTVTRTAKGKATVLRQRRIGFYKIAPEKIPWRESTNLMVTGSQQSGLVEWFTFAYLLGLGCLPGIAFYFVVIRPDRFQINLTDALGVTHETVYRSTSRDDAVAVARFTQDATGLFWREV